MFTVVLVDDEPWALLGMRNCYKWAEHGYKIIYETTSPLQALEVIAAQKPDIVLTDMRMNKMTGVELIESVRKAGLDTEFVIASGYDDFCYAKEAIRHRAFHYLLKPLNEEEVKDVFAKLTDHLSRKRIARERLDQVNLLDHFPYHTDALVKYLQDNGMGREYPYYQAVVVLAPQEGKKMPEFPQACFPVELHLSADKKAYLLNTGADIGEFAAAHWAEGGDVSAGISTTGDSMEKIGEKYREADIAVYSRFVSGRAGIARFEKKNIGELNRHMGKVLSKLDTKDPCPVTEALDQLQAVFVQNGFGIGEAAFFYNQFIANISYKYSDVIYRADLDFQTYEQLFKRFRDFGDLLDYLKDIVPVIQGRSPRVESLTNESFKKIVKYMEANYNTQLFLSDISRLFNINATYICDLFKKILGMTFTEYLAHIRMARAAELLKETDHTIMQVADEVGYGDYCYFSKLFKDQYGLTPTKYRKQNRG